MSPSVPESAPEPESNGWDLIEDYQVGKDVHAKDSKATRSFTQSTEEVDVSNLPTIEEMRATSRSRTDKFWRRDGSAAQDAEIMARIMAGKAERDAEALTAIDRSQTALESEARERIRERQQREIALHLEMQARSRQPPPADETPLQRALREAADAFLALGICPDHLEFIADLGKFCSWGGKLYDHTQLFALRDARGNPIYTVGPSPHGPATACYSPRERRWKVDQPVAPETHLTPVERLVPVPRRHADGRLRFSARQPGTVLMCEGRSTVYVVRNAVYVISHLQAAHVQHSGASPLFERLAERAETTQKRAAELARSSTDAVGETASTISENVIKTLGSATDSLTSMIASTTRFFRPKR